MPAGAKPGERRGGRAKGTPNRATVAKHYQQQYGVPPPPPIPPQPVREMFDVLEQIETVAKYWMNQAIAEIRKGNAGNRKSIGESMDKALKALVNLAPYRHARLASIDHKFPEVDLSRLTDAQLTDLAALVSTASAESEGQDTRGAGATAH